MNLKVRQCGGAKAAEDGSMKNSTYTSMRSFVRNVMIRLYSQKNVKI